MPRGRTRRSGASIFELTAMSLPEIACKLGVTPQAVRHVEKRALAKIRKEMLARKIVTSEGRYANG